MYKKSTSANNNGRGDFMNVYNEKRKRSTKERVGFYTALSVCLVAIGLAAYSTYTNFSGYFDDEVPTVPVNEIVTGITETETATQEPTTEATAPPTEETVTEPEYEEETTPLETKTALQTMLTVNTSLSYPLDKAKVIKEYSEDSVYNKTLNQWNAHTGVDFGCEKGDNVYSMGDGKAVRVYTDDILGTTVVVKSATYTAYYSGLSEDTRVKRGDSINTGDILGTADEVPGESLDESHVHIAVRVDGQYTDPLSLINNDE